LKEAIHSIDKPMHTLFNVRALIVTCFLWCTGTYVRISCTTWSTMHGMFL